MLVRHAVAWIGLLPTSAQAILADLFFWAVLNTMMRWAQELVPTSSNTSIAVAAPNAAAPAITVAAIIAIAAVGWMMVGFSKGWTAPQ